MNDASTSSQTHASVDAGQLTTCLDLLARLADDPSLADAIPVLGEQVARAYKRVRKQRRKTVERGARSVDRERHERVERVMNDPRPAAAFAIGGDASAPNDGVERLSKPRRCYICKADYAELHAFYHLLCPTCAAENFDRRSRRVDLAGRRALVTGGRIKIGYQLCLKLLRDGAEVLATTRFPRDAAQRFAREPDFDSWSDRLHLFRLDLLHLPSVQAFADQVVREFGSLDIVVNNAAQTVRREQSYFAELRAAECGQALPSGVEKILAHADAQLATAASAWPDDLAYNALGEPRDARPTNSWMLELPDVEIAELAEVMLVNAMGPFVLCSRLEPALRRSTFSDRYIVNVSAMEGSFSRETKTSRHPHTNMAKAALNMLTRTSAARLAEDGIYMNSVDTGWITDEKPHPRRASHRVKGFVPPLDEVDGAARVYDPILRGVSGSPVFGQFLKDYRSVAW